MLFPGLHLNVRNIRWCLNWNDFRFFFISDDELLSILGRSDPHCVQEHIIKMYDNIAKLQFITGSNSEEIVTGMISAEGEVITSWWGFDDDDLLVDRWWSSPNMLLLKVESKIGWQVFFTRWESLIDGSLKMQFILIAIKCKKFVITSNVQQFFLTFA